MNDNGVAFNQNAKIMASDENHYEIMMHRYHSSMQNAEKSASLYSDLNLERQRAFYIKDKSLKKLDRLLVEFDTNFSSNGGNVLWANTSDDAKYMIISILNNHKVKKVLKTNSSTLEEIGLNSFLEMKKIKVIDTNIGDFICNLMNERPYNTRSSALRLKTSEVADLYTSEFGIKENCNARQLTLCTKQLLKNEMLNAGAVITGANFLVSESGSVVLTENEGNIIKSCTYSPVHIIVAGIDKMIKSLDELNVLLPLSSFYEQKANSASYYHIINKPYSDDKIVQDIYLILIDNDRTKILEKEKQRSILSCVNCGACANVCPIYNIVGGHIYQNNHPGPVGTIIAPLMKLNEETSHFCSLCTSCGRCDEVCPINIPLKDLIIENRKYLIKEDKSNFSERYFFNYLIKKMSNRKNLDKYGNVFKDFELKQYIKKKWGNRREFPKFAKESFTDYWKNLNNIK